MKNSFVLFLTISLLAFYNCKTVPPAESNPTETTSKRSKRSGTRAAYLEAFLPTEMLGVQRSSITTERLEIANKDVIAAAAEYKGEDQMMRVTITDAAKSAGGMTGLAPWTVGKLDNKWEQGYERTADIEGYKGYESYDHGDQSGQSSIIINQRFIVSVDGERIAEGDTRKALKAIDLEKLASLK